MIPSRGNFPSNVSLLDDAAQKGVSYSDTAPKSIDEYHTQFLNKIKGSAYERLASMNPYIDYDYNPTIWDSIGDAFGFNTTEDNMRLEYQKAAREYDAQISQLMFENNYNSESSKSNRIAAAGMNPDLLGTGQASEAGEFAQEQTSPDTSKVGFSFNDFANVIMGAMDKTMSVLNTWNGFRKTASDLETAELTRDSIKQGMDVKEFEAIGKLVDIANPIVKAGLSMGISPSKMRFNEGGSLIYDSLDDEGNPVITATEYSLPNMKKGNRYSADLIKYANALLHQSSTIADVQGDMLKSQENSDKLQTHRNEHGNFGYTYELAPEDSWITTSLKGMAQMSYEALKKRYSADSKKADADVQKAKYDEAYFSGISGTNDAELHSLQTNNSLSMSRVTSKFQDSFESFIDNLYDQAQNGDTGSAVLLFFLNQLINTGAQGSAATQSFIGDAIGSIFN